MLSRRAVVALAAGLIVLLIGVVVLFAPGARETIAATVWPRATADPATLARQRTAAEHSIQRGYAKALAQLRQVRELRLAIPQSEADAIETKARADLAAVRRQGLGAIGGLLGLEAAGLEGYVTGTLLALDAGGSFADEPGALLAPALFDVVREADQLFVQVADTATRQLTRAPGSPAPTATSGASPRPPTERPSPSPTGP